MRYPMLESEIARVGLNTKIIAEDGRIGCKYNALRQKMRCEYPFTIDEAFAMKQVIGSKLTLDELFAKEEN